MESVNVLTVEDLACRIPDRTLFTNLNFRVRPGESIAIIGTSGTGKTTLLSMILGLKNPSSGRITVCGHELTDTPLRTRARIRRELIGAVFQDGELFPELTAAENVALALMLQKPPVRQSLAEARHILDEFGVPSDTLSSHLSGGERQRTALARALSSQPRLILADEPTGSLDTHTRNLVADELFTTIRKRELGLLVVTHDLDIADRADRVIDLSIFAPSRTSSR